MKKSDLKTGYFVELRNGQNALILGNAVVTLEDGDMSETGGASLGTYNNDLTDSWTTNSGWDIMRVYDECDGAGSNLKFKMEHPEYLRGKLLWERKEENPIVTIDGVEYSESTLRSLIKKATS